MQLLAVFDVIAGQGILDTTYLDLHKAFNNMWHKKITTKLQDC